MRKLLAVVLTLGSVLAFGNDGYMAQTGGALNFAKSKDVRLVKEHIRIVLGKERGDVLVDFEFKNLGKAQTVTMGFPEETSGDSDGQAIWNFHVWVDAIATKATRKILTQEDEDFKAAWIHQVKFGAGQTRKVRVKYQSGLGGNTSGMTVLTYILKTGGTWYGNVDSIQIDVDATKMLKGRELHLSLGKYVPTQSVLIQHPATWKAVSKNKMTTTLRNVKPDFDLDCFMIPGFWNFAINGKRIPLEYAIYHFGSPNWPVREGSEVWIAPVILGQFFGDEGDPGESDSERFRWFGLIGEAADPWQWKIENNVLIIDPYKFPLTAPMRDFPAAFDQTMSGVKLSDIIRALKGKMRYNAAKNLVEITLPKRTK